MEESSHRYERQMRLSQIGTEGQRRLQASTAAVVGLGALGCTGADLLARAGVGRLILIDRDVVDWSNLQRQSLYTEMDAREGRPKAEAARARLQQVNSEIRLDAESADLCAQNVQELLAPADLVLDGTDNFSTRWMLNDWAVSTGRAYVYAGVVSTYGLVGAIVPGGPCLRCTWPEPPATEGEPTCRSAGVLGPAVAVIAGLAAGEAMKILSGQAGAALRGFLHADVWMQEFQKVSAAPDPACPACVGREFPWLEGRRGTRAAEPVCGGNAVQVPLDLRHPDLTILARKLAGTVAELRVQPRHLRYRVGGLEVFLFADGRALVRGTEDPAVARALLAETLGG
jgi:adenylyltransferase/sulfurtransferase